MSASFDVIVVGGGVIGMASAWRLAQSGRRVLLLERNDLGQEASSAAAGMLGAQLEVSEPGAFYQLCLESRRMYADFVAELLECTGVDAQLVPGGILRLAITTADADALKTTMAWQVTGGSQAEWLDGEDVAAAEPALSAVRGALLLPDDSHVHAPLLARALAVAVERTCTVRVGTEVVDVRRDGHADGGWSVHTSDGSFAADDVVIAAGAWSQRLLKGIDALAATDVQPVKGQLLSIRPRGRHTLTHTVYHNHTYLVPKRDGTIVIGATEEPDAGFQRGVTIEAIAHLLREVGRIAPGLRDAQMERTWMGFRPATSDRRPWIGEVPGHPGLHVACGHFRNGILLTPVSAAMVAASVVGTAWPDAWQPFAVGTRARFGAKGVIHT